MYYGETHFDFETKFCRFGDSIELQKSGEISGYASVFGALDQGGDEVQKGAYQTSLKTMSGKGRRVKMLWQHDPRAPIGIWDEVREDEKGLFVRGHLLKDVQKGAEAIALIAAGAIDGLSIGYRTVKAEKNVRGRRLLHELDLWEISLVTFPMLPEARVQGKADADAGDLVQEMADAFAEASLMLAEYGQQ